MIRALLALDHVQETRLGNLSTPSLRGRHRECTSAERRLWLKLVGEAYLSLYVRLRLRFHLLHLRDVLIRESELPKIELKVLQPSLIMVPHHRLHLLLRDIALEYLVLLHLGRGLRVEQISIFQGQGPKKDFLY